MRKTILDQSNDEKTPQKLLVDVNMDLQQLHHDMKVLAWGCDLLWHGKFRTSKDNEYLSHFPVALLRALASRSGELSASMNDALKGAAL